MASNVANTQGERAASATANRWTTRDVLTFVIFNIVIIVATMVVKLAEDAVLSPQNTFFVGSWLFPLVSTPFYLVMADRIGKRGVLGGSILLFGEGMLFSGDTLFEGGPGATRWDYSSFEQIIESIQARLFTLPDATVVHTGHGPSTSVGAERLHLDEWVRRGW